MSANPYNISECSPARARFELYDCARKIEDNYGEANAKEIQKNCLDRAENDRTST